MIDHLGKRADLFEVEADRDALQSLESAPTKRWDGSVIGGMGVRWENTRSRGRREEGREEEWSEEGGETQGEEERKRDITLVRGLKILQSHAIEGSNAAVTLLPKARAASDTSANSSLLRNV